MMGAVEHLRASPAMRLTRATVVAAVAGGLGTVAHVSAGGLLPTAAWLGVGAAVLLWVAWSCLAGPASTLRVGTLVGGGQFFTHVLLTATAGHAGDHPAALSRSVAPLPAGPGADRLAPLTVDSAIGRPRQGSFYDLTMGGPDAALGWPASEVDTFAVPHWALHIGHDLTGPHMLMAVAHLLAAAGVAWWLAMGEHALWLLLCFVGVAVLAAAMAIVRLPVPSQPASSRPALRHVRRLVPPLPPPLLGAMARRGPPALTA
jgi:hypothetical protein